MTTKHRIILAAIVWGVATPASSQSTNLHQFSAITIGPSSTISLTLTGGVPRSSRNYFELFPIEASQNLVDWEPLVTLLRTNKSNDPLTYTDLDAAKFDQRFYRTPTNQLVTPFPRPTGPYAIGTFSRLFTDSSRTNRYGIKTNSSFMVQFWYPTQPSAGVLPAPYLDPRIAAIWYSYYSDNALEGSLPLFKSAVSHSLPDVAMVTNSTPFPVVFFSHGYQCVRTMDVEVMESLASNGYIAVAIDHTDAWVSVFPSGKILRGQGSSLPGRTLDARIVLDELTRLNEADGFFRGRLNLQHVGIFGHSFGGATTADVCAADPRFKAGLSLDGGGHSNLVALQIGQPFLIASGDDFNPVMPPYRAAFRSLFNQLAKEAYWFRLKKSDHFDFVETPWFANAPTPARLRTATILRAYILSFFNKYLKGQDDHLLDGPPADWPEVEGFLKK